MFNQSVSIVEFTKLYNILKEIKNLFKFNINNYQHSNDFLSEINGNNLECRNSIIIVDKKNNELSSHNQIDPNSIVVIDQIPIKIEIFLDKVNTHLIKKKYNFQSRLIIKNYSLNLNSRTISDQKDELKLTEREVDIIIFLKENPSPQPIDVLQKRVWDHSFNLETHTVETHIYRLRKKIKDTFNDENFIKSHDEGYLI